MMREKIEATGATFVSCDEYDQEQRLDAKDAVRVGKDWAFPHRYWWILHWLWMIRCANT